MTTLNLFIKPMTVELAARTLLVHNSMGICFYLTTGRSPFSLPHTLGLANKVQWYANPPGDVPTRIGNQLLWLAAQHWQHGLDKLDLNMLHLRMASMPPAAQQLAIGKCYDFFNRAKFLATMPERCKAMQMTDTIPRDVMLRLQTSLASLESSLLEKDSMMPQHLRNTHAVLISYPETVHLLDDKEIALIIDAAEVHTKTEIVKAAAAGKGATRKKVSADDL